jgi:hypothetical protein
VALDEKKVAIQIGCGVALVEEEVKDELVKDELVKDELVKQDAVIKNKN